MDRYKTVSTLFSPTSETIRVNSRAIVVHAGASFQLPVMIPKAGARVRWSFKVKDYDCQFGVASKMDEYAEDYLLKKQYVSPNMEVKGSMIVTAAGAIYLIWDNSYSWMRSKTVIYSLTVELPRTTIEDKQIGSVTLYKDIKESRKRVEQYEQQIRKMNIKLKDIYDSMNIKVDSAKVVEGDELVVKSKIKNFSDQKRKIEEKQNRATHSVTQISHEASFLLESDRIFSMCSCNDLLRLACVNSSFHRIIRQDSVWEQAFIHNDRRIITSVMNNLWIQMKWMKFNPTMRIPGVKKQRATETVNNSDSLFTNDIEEPLDPEELALKITKTHSIVFTDLDLVYRVNVNLGWYKTNDDYCYYVMIDDWKKMTFRIVYARLTATQLDFIIYQALSSTTMVPLPGTIGGRNGFYIDKLHRVTKWVVLEEKWSQVPI